MDNKITQSTENQKRGGNKQRAHGRQENKQQDDRLIPITMSIIILK